MSRRQIEHYIHQACNDDTTNCSAKINLKGMLTNRCGIINHDKLDYALVMCKVAEDYSFEHLVNCLHLTLDDISFEFRNTLNDTKEV